MKPERRVVCETVMLTVVAVIGSAPSAAAADRVCELITASEASAAVGATIRAGMPAAGESGEHLCRYMASRQGMLAIGLADQHGKEKYEKAKAKMQSDPALKPAAIAGLGDQAVFGSVSNGISELLVLTGDRSIEIALSGRAVDSSREVLIELARKALTRL